jgi:hypothetical protein
VALISVLASPANADQSSVVAPPDVPSYKELSAKWWQWAASTAKSEDGPFSAKGPNCGENQPNGKVFFLAGQFTSETTEKVCEVPRNKWLFLPVINVECSSNEVGTIWYGGTVAERRDCVNQYDFAPVYSTLYAELDDGSIVPQDQLKNYLVTSPNFPINAVSENAAWIPEGKGFSVSKGVWLLLAPLSPGEHIITFGGENVGGFSTAATYTITVE